MASKAADPKQDVKGDKKDPKQDAKGNGGDIKGLDDNAPSGPPIKLSSKDKKEFVVERKHAFISTLVKTSMENDDKAEEVPIPGVTGAILELVVNYMKEHKGVEPPIIEKPLRSKVMKDVCPHKWDAEFIDKIGDERQKLYDIILAANYMDVKSLLHLGSAKVASLIKGQPLEKIKEILDPAKKGDAKDAKAGGADAAAPAPAAAAGAGAGAAGATKPTAAAAPAQASAGAGAAAAAAAAKPSAMVIEEVEDEPVKPKPAAAAAAAATKPAAPAAAAAASSTKKPAAAAAAAAATPSKKGKKK